MNSLFSNRIIQALILLVAVLFLAESTRATTAVMLSDEQLITSSRVILIGEVQSVKAHWNPDHQYIATYVKVKVSQLLRGQLQNEQIVFKQLGGAVGDQSTIIFGAPEYKIGQRVLLFLDTASDGTLRIAHLFQGKYDINDDPATGTTRVERNVDNDLVNILGVSESPEITNRATLTKFSKRIKKLLRVKADQAARYEAQYGDAPIVEVPTEFVDEAPNDNQPGDLSAAYTFLNNSRWFEPDTALPVTFRVNPASSPIAGGGNTEINQALAAWTGVQTTALVMQNGGSTTAFGFQQDGVTSISYNDPLDQMSDPVGCSGILAIGGVTSAGSPTRIIGGQSFYKIYEGDVVFNRNFSCFLGISANLAEVATHEIGHAIGFGHSSDLSAIMYASAHGQGRGATLGSDDIAAVSFLYPGSKSTQRFTDVPLTHPYYAYIEKIALRGITLGCTTTTYCPDGLVTRAEMAVFIERTLGVFSPPTPSSQRFVDVPPNQWSYKAVDSFVQHGLSAGIMNVVKSNCNADGLHFCPGKQLTRAEMAAWLVIAFGI